MSKIFIVKGTWTSGSYEPSCEFNIKAFNDRDEAEKLQKLLTISIQEIKDIASKISGYCAKGLAYCDSINNICNNQFHYGHFQYVKYGLETKALIDGKPFLGTFEEFKNEISKYTTRIEEIAGILYKNSEKEKFTPWAGDLIQFKQIGRRDKEYRQLEINLTLDTTYYIEELELCS